MTASRAPLVTVITPTWQRHDLLLDRCIPSVQAQEYLLVEHVIVSDGPDDSLAFEIGWRIARNGWKVPIRYYELPEHDPEKHWGVPGRLAAIKQAHGDYITYCDDDDALRPGHCGLMARALLDQPEAGFAVSRMLSHHESDPSRDQVFGWGPLALGNVGTPMIMHRREILEHGTWGSASYTEDWDLVRRWLDAGVTCANVSAETSDVYPSYYRDHPEY